MQLLIVDDEPNLLLVLKDLFSEQPYAVSTASEFSSAKDSLTTLQPEVVVCDLRLDGHTGLELLELNQQLEKPAQFIFLTAHGDVETAVRALKGGAFDFLIKPAEDERLINCVKRAFEKVQSESQREYLESEVERLRGGLELIGPSAAMRTVREQITKLARTASPVLIIGESGTGKELVARAVHAQSARSNRPLIVANCATVTEELLASEMFGHEKGAFAGADARRVGKFELADEGTLFLDEIGEMPKSLQAKLLRVLEDGKIERVGSSRVLKVDVRVIAATTGEFRTDLLHRLNTFEIKLPPLSERPEDILPIARHFLPSAMQLTAAAEAALLAYHWPGNVRELKNVIERAVVMNVGRMIEAEALALPQDQEQPDLQQDLRQREIAIITEALKRNGWIQARAAKELGLNRSHLHYKIKRLGIVVPE